VRVRTGTLCFGGGSICSDADFPFFGFPRSFRHLFGVGCFVTASIDHTVWNRVSAVALFAVLARYWLEDFGGTTI
jgi:hypothetical protein